MRFRFVLPTLLCYKFQLFPDSQAGLATLIVAAIAPLGGIVSFRKLGPIDRFPENMHGGIKWAHRKVLFESTPLLDMSHALCPRLNSVRLHTIHKAQVPVLV